MEDTMLKYGLAAALVLSITGPVLAEEYYVVRDETTKKCTIVDKKPTTKTTTIVSEDGVMFKSRTEAETGMKSIKVCTSE
jgi:hypothetical protein